MTSVISKSEVRLFLVAALLLCFISATAYAEDHAPAAVTKETAPCKGLKPFNNIDELLYQFYINMESDCLFEMPVEELEKVWGINILYRKGGLSIEESIKESKERRELEKGPDFRGKPYLSAKDAFYVRVSRNHKDKKKVTSFFMEMTLYYDEHYGSLFPPDSPPQLLPPPSDDVGRGSGLYWPNNKNKRKIFCKFSSAEQEAARFIKKYSGSNNWPEEWPEFKDKERIISCSFF